MSDDLIRRSDAIKAIWGDDINPSEDGMVFEAQSHIDRDIRLIPSADRPQGGWTYHMDEVGNVKTVSCPLCGGWVDVTIPEQTAEFAYCPYCGAKMDGEREGE